MQAVSASTSAGSIGREHRDAQLVAAELAVRLGVDDAVGAQHLGDRGGVDAVGEVDRADDLRALRRVRHERRGVRRSSRPRCRAAPDGVRGARRRPSRGRRCRSASRSGRPAGTAWRPPGCCRSGPCAELSIAIGRSKNAGIVAAGRRRSRRPAPARPGTSARSTGRRRRRSTSAARSSRRRSRATSTGRPPAPEVASTSTSASASAPAGRHDRHRDAGRGLVVGQRVDVDVRLGPRQRVRCPAPP